MAVYTVIQAICTVSNRIFQLFARFRILAIYTVVLRRLRTSSLYDSFSSNFFSLLTNTHSASRDRTVACIVPVARTVARTSLTDDSFSSNFFSL